MIIHQRWQLYLGKKTENDSHNVQQSSEENILAFFTNEKTNKEKLKAQTRWKITKGTTFLFCLFFKKSCSYKYGYSATVQESLINQCVRHLCLETPFFILKMYHFFSEITAESIKQRSLSVYMFLWGIRLREITVNERKNCKNWIHIANLAVENTANA